MNIGIVTTWFERGAAYVSRQYRDILEKEHEVFIYARGGEQQAKNNSYWDDTKVYWAKRFYRESTEIDLNEFGKWIKNNSIDMVLFNEQRWWDAVQYCKENSIISGSYIDYYTEETIPLFGLYDFLICNTKRHLSAFEWHPQAIYIPWGTDLELFKPKVDVSEKLYTTFFHSAGMAPHRKGTEQVIKAFMKIKNEDAKLLIHTQVDLCKILPELKLQINELKLQGRLRIVDKTVSAPGLYTHGDVYVYPSHLEGIGLTIVEALSCGLPVLTVDFPPMNEFVNCEVGEVVPVSRIYARADGYYWPKNDVDLELFAKAMDKYCLDGKEHNRIKGIVRKYAEDHFDWSKNASELLLRIKSIEYIDSKVSRDAALYLRKYNRKHRKTVKTLIRDYFPSVYSVIRNLIKGFR